MNFKNLPEPEKIQMEFFKSLLSNDPTSILILILGTLLSLCLINLFTDKYYRTPGPWGIPILGFYPFLSKTDFHNHFTNMIKKFGDPYTFNLCGKRYIHLGTHKSLREAFVSKADCFAKRPMDYNLFHYIFAGGIVYQEGEALTTLKKFLIRSMRELGIGAKEQLRNPLSFALKSTITTLKESKNQPINLTSILTTKTTEVIKDLILGEDVSPELAKKINNDYIKAMTPAVSVYSLLVGNLAKYLILRKIPGYETMITAKNELDRSIYEIVENHKSNLDPENPRDWIDLYLIERKIRKEKNDPSAKYFTDDVLVPTLIEIYGDGGLSIGAFIVSYLRCLAPKQDLQKELYEEISKILGTERLPTYEDRARLPLMNSVIKELERTAPVLSSAISLEATKNTTISGVYVPKGTIALFNYHGVHHDPGVFKDPHTFNPRRFLPTKDQDQRRELPVSFGIGRRACPGESLVTTEIFLFLTSIFQNFTISLEKKNKDEPFSVEKEFSDTWETIIIATPR